MKKGILVILLFSLVAFGLLAGCTKDYKDVKAQSEEITCPTLNLGDLKVDVNPFDSDLYSVTPALSTIKLPDGIMKDKDELNFPSCKKGSEKGELANHYYCDPWYLKKVEADASGAITGEQNFIVLFEFGEDKTMSSTKCYTN